MNRRPLRSYAPLVQRSAKVEAAEGAYAEVYREVDLRSDGRCEVASAAAAGPVRCRRRAVEHHHLFKPRRSHHTAEQIVHICRQCHDRVTVPFVRGRLCYVGTQGAHFLFALRYASDKFAARATD